MHTTQQLVNRILSYAVATAPLPSLIAPAPRPFALEEPTHVGLQDLLSIHRNLRGIQQQARQGFGPVDPGTVHLLCEHIVGLHKQLMEGTTTLTRQARNVTTKQGLLDLLERTYDVLEPLAA